MEGNRVVGSCIHKSFLLRSTHNEFEREKSGV